MQMTPYLIKYIYKELLRDIVEKANNLGYEIITINTKNKTVLVHNKEFVANLTNINAVDFMILDEVKFYFTPMKSWDYEPCLNECFKFFEKQNTMKKKYELIKTIEIEGIWPMAVSSIPRTEQEWIRDIPILSPGDCERKTEWFREVKEPLASKVSTAMQTRDKSFTGEIGCHSIYVNCSDQNAVDKLIKFLNETALPLFEKKVL